MMMDTTRVYEVRHRKAHTKLQERCLALRPRLPELTEGQKRWMRSKMKPLGYFVMRGRGGKKSVVWCQECGQMDEVGVSPLALSLNMERSHVCSGCGRRLDVRSWNSRNKEVRQDFMAGFVTTCEEMQVVRMYDWQQYNKMGSATEDVLVEVFSVWIDMKKGREVILSRPYTRSFYNFRWITNGAFRVAKHNGGYGGYYVSEDTYSLDNYHIYPRMKVQPILKRNGWKNEMSKMRTSPVTIWRGLLSSPAVEGLAKMGQYGVLDHFFREGGDVSKMREWLPMVKICRRRGYVIKDASMWFDNLTALRELGMDTRSPKYICPEDLTVMHDWLQEKVERKREKERMEREKKNTRMWEEKYRAMKEKYFGVRFDDGRIFCHVIQSVGEMCEEGTKMHHCVYTMGYYKKAESLILSARDKDGKRLETVEVNLKTYAIVQSRGLQNANTSEHDDIISLVRKNMNLIRTAGRRRNIKK